MLFEERANRLRRDISSAAMARRSVGESECSDSADEISWVTVEEEAALVARAERQRVTVPNLLREQLAEAEREDKRAYVRATKDGWAPKS
ncbi:hypothetical protein [Arthrobacter oryzae]|uniref:hypothetical protein n=1 Tax=Arthrobacter oryzae TaxID=409290 RepID=UPI00285932FB|nr:hypothetical protein [Arthrobacter oryzae]